MVRKKKTDNRLTEYFKRTHFRRIERTFRRQFRFGLETLSIDGEAIAGLCSADCTSEFCKVVGRSRGGGKRCFQERLRSLSIAFETGQPYICLCHAGIVSVCVPIMERDIALGGLFFGKCLWGPLSREIEQDIVRRLRGVRFDADKLLDAAYELAIVTSRRIHDAAEFLFILLYEVTGLDPMVIKWRREKTEQQSQISDYIHQSKRVGIRQAYPYDSERKLIEKVRTGDRTGSNEILNSLLGNIMFCNPGDLNVLKARLLELLSVLSRAAAEAGVNIELLLKKNLGYTTRVMDIDTQEELCAWINRALRDFTDSVYALRSRRKNTKAQIAVRYIEENYRRQITVADVAKAVHLSPSRAAHLFKECMDISIIDYLTQVRIGRAKERLLSGDDGCATIGFEAGYNSQSYFIRSFKRLAGMTPRQFRRANSRTGRPA